MIVVHQLWQNCWIRACDLESWEGGERDVREAGKCNAGVRLLRLVEPKSVIYGIGTRSDLDIDASEQTSIRLEHLNSDGSWSKIVLSHIVLFITRLSVRVKFEEKRTLLLRLKYDLVALIDHIPLLRLHTLSISEPVLPFLL